MKIENVEVYGFNRAIHGMRNPMNSWNKSDSKEYIYKDALKDSFFDKKEHIVTKYIGNDALCINIGENDNQLAKKLIKAGNEHRKFLRLIHVSCFLTIPRYIWQELDTYKISTTRVSCSTMHKLGMTDLTIQDFQNNWVLDSVLQELNFLGKSYRETKDVEILRQMKLILPEGFLQGAEYDFNYENAINIYHQRKNHRMIEWSGKDGICEMIANLPMMNEWLNL